MDISIILFSFENYPLAFGLLQKVWYMTNKTSLWFLHVLFIVIIFTN